MTPGIPEPCQPDVEKLDESSFFYALGFINFKNNTTMPLFRITVKSRVNTNGIRLEPGMSVDVVSQSFSDPVHTNGGQSVADAFMRIYGVDIKKAGALNGIYLDVKRIG